MARRRDPDKPVERLRSSWTSTEDLEETLAQMFHQPEAPAAPVPPTVPGDKLPPPRPVNLSDVPPVSLTAGAYRTLDGLVVDGKCIRPFESAQNGHTLAEHMVYTAMWRLLGAQNQESESREGLLPMRLIAAKVSLSVRNLRRVLHSLMDKLAVDVTEFEDKTKSIPRRYRVWSPQAVAERRRKAGYLYVYRNRNLITLAKPHDKLSGE